MVMAKKETGYEKLRRQRLEENKKKMEELQLRRLSLALKSSSPKPSSMIRVKRTEMVEVRRSGRVANLPGLVYKEIVSYEDIPRSMYRIHGYKRDLSNRVYASDEARASATLKAEELESSLGADYPTFVKPMLQSHVTGFWLGLPGYWCSRHLQMHDDTVTLIDEEGEEYPTMYLSPKSGLSGGWSVFSIAHGLLDGDALVFQLIRPAAFKVYIIRVKSFEKGSNIEDMEARASTTLKAEELESSLGADYPTFVKPMLQSHVTGGFWLETGYEELRQQRLEENKKSMEELHPPRLSLALKSPSPKPSLKTPPMKRVKQTKMVEVGRSGQVANLPDPAYKEIVSYEDIPRRIHGYKRDLSNWVCASDEARASATLKAEELESSLGADYPTFVKPLLQSHVIGFWLGLPGYWCRRYLPKRDDTVTLIDEEGEEYPTMYMSRTSGLSGGWRVFTIAHGLVDGDALVFQLIRPIAFKVYIIRVKGFEKGTNLEDMDA